MTVPRPEEASRVVPGAVDRPLAGIVVLDLLAAPLAGITRVYAELGAEVVRIEPLDAYGGADAVSYEGLDWLAANLGKSVIGEQDSAALRALANRADLIVTGLPTPGEANMVEALFDADCRDGVVVMTVSMFGADNRYSGWQATDPVLHALTGELSRSGLAGRAPLLPPGELALHCAMAQAAYVGMAGLFAAKLTGRGDRLDVSILEAAMQALDPAFGISGSATLGRAARHLPPGRPAKGLQYPIFPCADGQIRLCLLAPRQWRAMFEWMDKPQEFAGPEFDNTGVRQQSPALLAALARFVAGQARAELEREGMARGVPISGLLTLDECLETPQLAARHAIATATPPAGPALRMPNGVIEIDGQRMSALHGALPASPPASFPTPLPVADPAKPLAGLKVLDLGVIVVGGEQSRLLADLGADVVKVESAAFPDGTRHSYLPTGLSVSFAAGHRNKRSLGLNLRHAEGKALFRRLAAEADVILSNFKPGTMESLGFGYADLAMLNPKIVTVESSAFGATGPWAGRMGYGPLVRAAAGLTAKWRYPDDAASYSDSITIYPDHVGARYGAIAVLALLLRRLRTGRGGSAAISQLEVMLAHFSAEIARADLGVDTDEPHDSPWGVFRASGSDDWCVVTVRDDADWAAFVSVMDHADWRGPDFATSAHRRPHRAAIDRAVAQWMRRQDADDAMRRLQSARVPAARMLRAADLPDFDYFRERGFFRVDRHPFIDEPIVAESRHAISDLLAEPDRRPAPLMGQHSAEVVRDWLGLADAEIERLIRDTVLEPTTPEIARMTAAGEGRGPP